MNILLWIVQGLLALLCVSGGAFKLAKPDDVTKQVPALGNGGWRFVGLVELVGGILLIVPAVLGWMPALTVWAAMAIALENVAISILYAQRSTKLVAANPLVWSATMAVLAIGVAAGRTYGV